MPQEKRALVSSRPKTAKAKIKEKYEIKRNQLWPAFDDNDFQNDEDRVLWESKRKKGFVNIPRAMPLVLKIMDYLSPKPVSSTYLSLWCRDFGTGFIEIHDIDTLAAEAGFNGVRATGTLNSRLRLLSNETDQSLGFIRAKKSTNGKYKSILMLNPMLVIHLRHQDNKLPQNYYDELFNRCADIGDKDLLNFQRNDDDYNDWHRKFLDELK